MQAIRWVAPAAAVFVCITVGIGPAYGDSCPEPPARNPGKLQSHWHDLQRYKHGVVGMVNSCFGEDGKSLDPEKVPACAVAEANCNAASADVGYFAGTRLFKRDIRSPWLGQTYPGTVPDWSDEFSKACWFPTKADANTRIARVDEFSSYVWEVMNTWKSWHIWARQRTQDCRHEAERQAQEEAERQAQEEAAAAEAERRAQEQESAAGRGAATGRSSARSAGSSSTSEAGALGGSASAASSTRRSGSPGSVSDAAAARDAEQARREREHAQRRQGVMDDGAAEIGEMMAGDEDLQRIVAWGLILGLGAAGSYYLMDGIAGGNESSYATAGALLGVGLLGGGIWGVTLHANAASHRDQHRGWLLGNNPWFLRGDLAIGVGYGNLSPQLEGIGEGSIHSLGIDATFRLAIARLSARTQYRWGKLGDLDHRALDTGVGAGVQLFSGGLFSPYAEMRWSLYPDSYGDAIEDPIAITSGGRDVAIGNTFYLDSLDYRVRNSSMAPSGILSGWYVDVSVAVSGRELQAPGVFVSAGLNHCLLGCADYRAMGKVPSTINGYIPTTSRRQARRMRRKGQLPGLRAACEAEVACSPGGPEDVDGCMDRWIETAWLDAASLDDEFGQCAAAYHDVSCSTRDEHLEMCVRAGQAGRRPPPAAPEPGTLRASYPGITAYCEGLHRCSTGARPDRDALDGCVTTMYLSGEPGTEERDSRWLQCVEQEACEGDGFSWARGVSSCLGPQPAAP